MIFEQTARDFATDQEWKTAGILCVFQGFSSAELGEKIRFSATNHFLMTTKKQGKRLLQILQQPL